MKILGTICARGGSKGVPGKNIRMLNGKPLIAHSIEQALKWGRLDDLIVSTDDEKIAEVAVRYGARVPFTRPPELASDTAGKLDALRHAVNYLETVENTYFDVLFDLDPTSPLRIMDDLEEAFRVFTENDVNNVYSVCEAHKNPYFNMVELDENNRAGLCKTREEGAFLSRQRSPKVYEMNASIYIYKIDFVKKSKSVHSDNTMVYVMPQERSVDIDNMIDFEFVEFLMKRGMESGLYR